MKDYLEIKWETCKPYFYGKYKGKLKNGKFCTIDVDWKIKITDGKDSYGTNEIECWLCTPEHVASLINKLEA